MAALESQLFVALLFANQEQVHCESYCLLLDWSHQVMSLNRPAERIHGAQGKLALAKRGALVHN